ncbi:MAG TPA: hypothetical protein VFZ59_25240 [Verrucomicrobiae bacterium]|nr:hypothetical protein [Verrucomicrobiae bacterium]
MTLEAKKDLAMILPVPVKLGTDEKGLTFIDLSGYPEFFSDLFSGFPVPIPASKALTRSMTLSGEAAPKLEVVKVGSFEASFVPTMKDFSRLDERFRISDTAWKELPTYKDYGFAVFKLKSGDAKIHPMAFSFPRRDTRTLFFPTVHIHDGKVHRTAKFDHSLYCQPGEMERPEIHDWQESYANASRFMKTDKAKGLILADQHCYQKRLSGRLSNQDTIVNTFA